MRKGVFMKNILFKSLYAIAALLLIIFFIVFINIKKNNYSEHEVVTGSYIEYSNKYSVSKNGSTIYAFKTIPDSIVESAKNYIKENNFNDSNIVFCFKNSRYTFSPQYVVDNVLDVYNPEQLKKEYTVKSDEYLYYVEEILYKNKKDNFGISVGYFVINQNGDIVEEKYLKTIEELSEYQTEPDLEYDVINIAREKLSLDESAYITDAKRFFYYNSDNEGTLCYKVQFNNNDQIYINAITGDEIK